MGWGNSATQSSTFSGITITGVPAGCDAEHSHSLLSMLSVTLGVNRSPEKCCLKLMRSARGLDWRLLDLVQ